MAGVRYMRQLDNPGLVPTAALNRFSNRLQRERFPSDPPQPPSLTATRRDSDAASDAISVLLVDEGGADAEVAAVGEAEIVSDGSGAFARVSIQVDPGLRQNGLGRAVATALWERVRATDASCVVATTYSGCPAGRLWSALEGGELLDADVTLDLRLDQLDAEGLTGELSTCLALTPRVVVSTYASPLPESLIAGIAQLRSAYHEAPRLHQGLPLRREGPNEFRMRDSSYRRGGQERLAAIAHDDEGTLLAYSAGERDARWPAVASHGLTAVRTSHRGLGLARIVKLALILRMLREWPDTVRLRTTNGVTNRRIGNLNSHLGLHAVETTQTWRLDTAIDFGASDICAERGKGSAWSLAL